MIPQDLFKPSKKFTMKLSLLDLDRFLSFADKLLEEISAIHIRLGEESFFPLTEKGRIREILEKEGIGELDYITLSSLRNFTITADFLEKEIRFRALREEKLNELVSLWRRT